MHQARSLPRLLAAAVAGVVLTASCLVAGPAFARFTATGAGTGSGGTATLTPPGSAAATATGSTVWVTWTAAVLSTGLPPQGYYLTRTRTSDQTTAPACGTSPTALLTGTSCSDGSLSDGNYTYQVVAVYQSWTATSNTSNTVTVATVPSITVALVSPAPNANGYNNTSPVTLTLTATQGSIGTPVASVTAWVDSGTPTTTTGAAATVKVSGDGTHVVSYYATDAAGRRSLTGTYTVRIDTSPPPPRPHQR